MIYIILSFYLLKSLTMNNAARVESTVGEIVNLMSVDAEQVRHAYCMIWAFVSCPLSLILSMWFLYNEVQCTLDVAMFINIFEPSHEIMVVFVFRKLILQTHMHSYPVGLDIWFLFGPFINFHTLCVRTAKALARLRGCRGSPEPSLVAYVISTIVSWAGSFFISKQNYEVTIMLNHCHIYYIGYL